MDRLPPPYDRDVVLEPGEALIGCWRGVPVRLTPSGRIDDAVWYYGRVLQDDPDTSHGLLVLTNWNLRHYIQDEGAGPFGTLQADAVDELTIPHRDVVDLEVVQGRALPRPLIRVRSVAETPEGSSGESAAEEEHEEFYFLLDDRENVPSIVARIAQAVGATGTPVAAGPPAPTPPEPEPPGRPEEGPIHFHAEREPD